METTKTTTPTAGRPAIAPEQRRNRGITLKVNQTEYEQIHELAKLNGTSLVNAVVDACKVAIEDHQGESIINRVHNLENRVGVIEEHLLIDA